MKLTMLTIFMFGLTTGVFATDITTRKVADAAGLMVEVPIEPRRVVALSEIDLDSSLALGLTPIATVNGRGQSSHPNYLKVSEAAGRLEQIPIVGDLGRPNMEALVRLKPDLILTSPSSPQVLLLLKKIAPTVVTFQNGDNWKKVFERVAKVLGREDKASEFMASYEMAIATAKTKLAAIDDKTVSIVRWNPNGPAFMYQDSFASLVLREMGLERPESQKIAGERHSMALSLEALDIIDAGWLFVGTLDPKGDAVEAMQEIKERSSFQKLSAVKSKHVFAVDGSKWTSIGGPLAALSIVNETAAMISGTP